MFSFKIPTPVWIGIAIAALVLGVVVWRLT